MADSRIAAGDLHYLEEELLALFRMDDESIAFLRDHVLDGMWYWDLERPENEWMSENFWRLFGYDPADKRHLATEWQDIIFAEDLEVAHEHFERQKADPNHPYDQMFRQQEFVDELVALGFDVEVHDKSPLSFYYFWGRAEKMSGRFRN